MLLDLLNSRFITPVAFPFMAVTSGTYWYPLRGIFYFIRTPSLWGPFFTVAGPMMLLTFVVFTLCYIFLYPTEAAISFFFNGPAGVVTAWIAISQQAMAFTRAIAGLWLLPTPLRIMFDSILSREGQDRLVLLGELRKSAELSERAKVARMIKRAPKKILWPVSVARLLVHIILTFIPVIGPMITVVLDAKRTGVRCQERYFELKGFDEAGVKSYTAPRTGEYFSFGVIAGSFEAIPVIGSFFHFTNIAGGALWAVDVERHINPRKDTRSGLRALVGL